MLRPVKATAVNRPLVTWCGVGKGSDPCSVMRLQPFGEHGPCVTSASQVGFSLFKLG